MGRTLGDTVTAPSPTGVAEAGTVPPVAPPVGSRPSRGQRFVHAANRPWLRVAGVLVAVVVALWSLHRVPGASWPPALLGLVPWVIGKYVLCPLRWHALSVGGRTRRWHLRVYAESELLGLASPGHVGADLWRVRRLETQASLSRACAVAEVGLDRLIGAIGLSVFVLLAGSTLPPRLIVAALGIASVIFAAGVVLMRRRPGLLAARPWPPLRVVLLGVGLSVAYQLSIIGLLLGTVGAMGGDPHPLALIGVFGASQVAGIIPGVNGASPREGALVVGLASLGIAWQAALGAVALTALLAWAPALLFGGGSLLSHRIMARRRGVAFAR
jgi:hypothetical protein